MHSDASTPDSGAYEAPQVSKLGTVESWTKGASTGLFLDASFPANTPIADLTFTLLPF